MHIRQKELAHKQFSSEIKQKREQISDNKKKQQEIEGKLKSIRDEVKTYESFKKEFDKEKAQFEKRRVFYQNLVQRGNWVQRELNEINRKQVLVQDKDDPSCQPNNGDDQQEIMKKFEFTSKKTSDKFISHL